MRSSGTPSAAPSLRPSRYPPGPGSPPANQRPAFSAFLPVKSRVQLSGFRRATLGIQRDETALADGQTHGFYLCQSGTRRELPVPAPHPPRKNLSRGFRPPRAMWRPTISTWLSRSVPAASLLKAQCAKRCIPQFVVKTPQLSCEIVGRPDQSTARIPPGMSRHTHAVFGK